MDHIHTPPDPSVTDSGNNPRKSDRETSSYDSHLFLVEDILLMPHLESLELSIFTSATLCSIIHNYPAFRIGEDHIRSDIIEFYHLTSDPRYKLFQILIDGLKRKGVALYWLQSPIFFGQL
jgi:hypothetical protein